MKVLHITTDYRPNIGGIATHIEQLNKYLNIAGVESEVLHIVENSTKSHFEHKDDTYRLYMKGDLRDFKKLLKMKFIRRIIDEISPDILHVHTFNSLEYIVYKWKYPWVWTAHFSSLEEFVKSKNLKVRILRKILGKIWNDACTIIAVSKDIEMKVRSLTDNTNIITIPNGVDLNLFKLMDGDERRNLRRKLGICENCFVIFFPSRWAYVKGLHVLLKALKILNEQGIFLLIAGNPSEDEYSKTMNEELKHFENKFILGNVPYGDMPKYYAISDIAVIPSLYETFGMSILEAMACGVPVIASNVGGIKDIVKHGKNGLLFEKGDAKELSLLIKKLMNDRKLYEKIKMNALLSVRNYSWENIANKVRKVYESSHCK